MSSYIGEYLATRRTLEAAGMSIRGAADMCM